MKIEEILKEKWNNEHCDGLPAFTEMTGAGFTYNMLENKIPVYKICVSYYKNEECDWLTLNGDPKRIGQKIVSSFIDNPNQIIKLNKKWLESFEKMFIFFAERFEHNIKQLSNGELVDWINEVHNFYRYELSMPGFLDGFTFYADKRFLYLLKEYCQKNDLKNYQEIFSILSSPIEPSFINTEENELRRILELIKSKKTDLKDVLMKRCDEEIINLLQKHLIKYVWIKSNYTGYIKYTWKEMVSELERIDLEKTKGEEVFEKNKKIKENYFKKHKFNKEIKAIAKLSEIFIKWQDQRKEYTLTFVSLHSKILKEISRRFNIDYGILVYASKSDLIKIINNEFNLDILKERKKECLIIYEEGKAQKILTGKRAEDLFKSINNLEIENTKEISGMVASTGKVIGKAKIVMSIKNINKVKNGDILVAPMTRPEHLSGMRKSAAIVTDDGGITCHAAIVARELKIPCIIGTKIATKVLHDGDIIEVDADKGIVKIINTKL